MLLGAGFVAVLFPAGFVFCICALLLLRFLIDV